MSASFPLQEKNQGVKSIAISELSSDSYSISPETANPAIFPFEYQVWTSSIGPTEKFDTCMNGPIEFVQPAMTRKTTSIVSRQFCVIMHSFCSRRIDQAGS